MSYKTLLRNRDIKRLLENFFSLSILQVLTMFLPLITLPYIMGVIGSSNYGVIILANSFLNYFVTLSDFSFNITATREIAVHRHSRTALIYIYNKVFNTQLFILLVSAIIYFSTVFLYPKFSTEAQVFAFTFIALLGKTIFPDWFFQGVEKMRFITIFNVTTRLLFVVCIFVFVKEEKDYVLHPLFLGLGSLVSGIIAQVYIYKVYQLRYRFIGLPRIFKVMNSNFGIFINQFLPQLYNNSTTLILGVFAVNSTVGVYGAMKAVVDVFVTIVRTISRVFFPFLSRNSRHFVKFSYLIIGTGLLATACILLFSNFIPNYLNVTDDGATSILIVLGLGVPFLAMYQCYGTNYFLVKRKDSIVIRNTFVSSVIGFITSFPLVIIFGGGGAAANLTICRILMGGGLYLKFRREQNKT